MIVDLPSTTTAAVSKKLVRLRNDVGAMALGRVLTLLIVADEQRRRRGDRGGQRRQPAAPLPHHRRRARATSAAPAGSTPRSGSAVTPAPARSSCSACTAPSPTTATASSSRCCCPTPPSSPGGRAGAPGDVSADPIGAMAQRRITDAAEARNPHKEMQRPARRPTQPGDTDLAWTRVTLWRGLLAAALDQPPYEPVVSRHRHRWQRLPLDRPAGRRGWPRRCSCPVTRARTRAGTGMVSVRLERRSGDIDLVRPDGVVATLVQPGQPVRRITPVRGGSWRSAWPTSCAGWTPTRSTPRPSPRAWSRWAAAR